MNVIILMWEILNLNSLFDIVNNTSTALGRRFLKIRLAFPLISKTDLKKSYKYTEQLLDNNLYNTVESYLKHIIDIERLYRKIILKLIHPYELAEFIKSYGEIQSLIEIINNNEYLQDLICIEIKDLNEFYNDAIKIFNQDELKKYNINDINCSFFNIGIYPNIDEVQEDINNNVNYMDKICSILSEIVDNGKENKKKMNVKYMLKKNDKEGYYLLLTKKKSKYFKKTVNKNKNIKYL